MQSLLAAAARLGVFPDRIVCTGDIVAYCADARATVALIRAAGVHVVMGNCEESLGWGHADCGCGFAEGTACDRAAAQWYPYADRQLDEDDRAWMRSLPRRIDVLVGGHRFAVVHGAVDRINTFIFASVPDEELRRQIALAGCDGVIGGHCGLPFTRIVSGSVWHNCGTIGLPANDGTTRTWFSLIEPLERGLRIRNLPLDYDFASAARKMRMAGLPEGYATALETGLWPSCDVLPPAERTRRGEPLPTVETIWQPNPHVDRGNSGSFTVPCPIRAKFSDPDITAGGEPRASVHLVRLETLWFNTGTLCNLACDNCYIESSPRNDRLVYLSRAEVGEFLGEAGCLSPPPDEIGFTGGEPFMNPDILGMIEDALTAGFRALVLTNAMKPMQRLKGPLLDLGRRHGGQLTLRVSLDHYGLAGHEKLRGAATWQPTIDGLMWLCANGFAVTVAGRTIWGESEAELRAGYRSLFAALQIPIDADDPARLVLFPEMEADADVPEITERCWNILGKSPSSVMCASSRMVVKRKGAGRPVVVSCTLLPYDETFELGATLAEAARPVKLNHRHCAQFCVLGGASCSGGN
ncbi:MAG: radical SAM protein [Rhodospirillales bacterium]|nr:radical SAM protein [Rhodospirillales bacterium]